MLGFSVSVNWSVQDGKLVLPNRGGVVYGCSLPGGELPGVDMKFF